MSPHLLRVLARLGAFWRANGKVSAARRNARVRPRGHLIESMESQPYVDPDLGMVGPSHGYHNVVLLALSWTWSWNCWAFAWLTQCCCVGLTLALILEWLGLRIANTMLSCWPYVGPDPGLVGPSHGQHYVVLLALRWPRAWIGWALAWPTLCCFVGLTLGLHMANTMFTVLGLTSKITWFQR